MKSMLTKLTKGVSLMLALLLVVGVFAGCASKPAEDKAPDTNVPATETSETKDESTEEDATADKPSSISIALKQASNVENYETNYLTTLLEDEFGIDIDFMLLPADGGDAKSKFAVMASSNTELTDIVFNVNFTTLEIADYGSKGIFIPLNDYLTDAGKMPYFNEIPAEDKDSILVNSTSPDGNIYYMSKFSPVDWNLTPYRLWLNEVWLDKLDLEVPETTDEFYEVLKAFKTQDPNGNGVADEIPLTGTTKGWGTNSVYAIMNAFTFYDASGNSNGGLALGDDGKTVVAPFVTEEWKAGVEYMAMLCEEGLLSPALFTQDASQFTATLSNDTQIVGATSSGGTGYWSGADNNPNRQEMAIIPPLKGPDGIAYTPFTPYSPEPAYFISKDCENVDFAIEFGDFFYREDISITGRYGEEGVNWTKDPDVVKDYEGIYEDALGVPCTLLVIEDPWSEVQNQSWYDAGPRYQSLEDSYGTVKKETADEGADNLDIIAKRTNAEFYADAHPDAILPRLIYNEEEADVLAEIQKNIRDYVSQSLAEFITGNRPLSEWDAYLAELDNMELDQWLNVAQSAYDRMMQE